MKIGAIVRSYYLTDYLAVVLNQFDWIDNIIVPNRAYNKVEKIPDNTQAIIRQHGQKNVNIYVPEANTQHEIFNETLKLLADYDCVFICDADEIIFREDQDRIINYFLESKKDTVSCRVLDYADENHIYPFRTTHHPVVLVNPKRVRFSQGRCFSGATGIECGEIYIHHLGYVFPKEKMEWKKRNYWNPGNKNGMAELMDQVKQPFDAPELIKKLLKK